MELVPAIIRQRLEPQERVLWWGRPKGGIRFRMIDLFLVPFSLVWGGFAIFWEFLAISKDGPFFFALFGIPFVIIGLYLIAGRFFVDAWRRARTYYAVTQKRILILSRTSLKSLELRQLSEMGLKESRDGSGSLTFGPQLSLSQWNNNFGIWGGTPVVPTFESIPAASQVHATVRRAQADLERAS
jgi:hypothetical protein